MTTGRLRTYFGVAPGAGATRAALDEAHRRAAGGDLVVAGLLDAEAEAAAGLPPLPRVTPRGTWDASALAAARPQAVVVDALAAALPDGGRRWEVVGDLLAAGIDVIASTDVTTVASLVDAVEAATGRRPAAVVPDALLAGGQLHLVDRTPEALRRLAPGSLLDRPDADGVRPHSLVVLRSLRRLALEYTLAGLSDADAAAAPIVVAVSGGPGSAELLRHAVRAAAREPGATVLAVEVVGSRQTPDEGLGSGRLRSLVESLGAEYRQVIGSDAARALLDVAQTVRARRIVIGASPGLRHHVAGDLVRAAGPIEIDVLPGRGPAAPTGPLTAWSTLSRRRALAGLALAALLPGLATAGGLAFGAWLGLPAVTMLHLVAVVVVARVGGLLPAVLAALIGSTLLNYWFIPPLRTLLIGEPHNVLAVLVFVLVAVLVSAVVERADREATRAARASAVSRALVALADATLGSRSALPGMLEQARASFSMDAASLLSRDGDGWRVLDSAGDGPPPRPEDADSAVPAGDGLVLALRGRRLAADDEVILRGFAVQAQNLLERDRLARAADQADRLRAAESLRDALLAAVGHDLRRPLASARAALDGLGAPGIAWTSQERAELLATANDSVVRLSGIVDDLLDLSRLQTGALRVRREQVWLDDVIPPALDELGTSARDVRIEAPTDLPPAVADAALVRRIVANLVGNALQHGASAEPPTVATTAAGDRVELRVIDHGPGLGAQDPTLAFLPFQRSGDTDTRSGLGLGLALSRGLAEAMGGSLEPEETPGGGTTMTLRLPAAPRGDAP